MNDDEPDDELIKYDDAEEIIDINGDGESDNDEISTYDPETGEIKTKKRYQMKTKNMKVSKTDPDAGMYHKGEREKMFAYSASAICDKNGFVLSTYVTSGNIYMIAFHSFGIMDAYNYYNKDNKTKKVCLDAGYYVSSVLKSIYDSGKIPLVPYMRPKQKVAFLRKTIMFMMRCLINIFVRILSCLIIVLLIEKVIKYISQILKIARVAH